MIDETNLFVLDFFLAIFEFFFFSDIYYSEWKQIRNLKHDFDLFPIMEKGFYIFNKIERMMGMY